MELNTVPMDGSVLAYQRVKGKWQTEEVTYLIICICISYTVLFSSNYHVPGYNLRLELSDHQFYGVDVPATVPRHAFFQKVQPKHHHLQTMIQI